MRFAKNRLTAEETKQYIRYLLCRVNLMIILHLGVISGISSTAPSLPLYGSFAMAGLTNHDLERPTLG